VDIAPNGTYRRRDVPGALLYHRAMNQGPTIQQGAKGEDVKRLQRLLVMMKLSGFEQIDGVFGPKTAAAVKDFQQGAGLTVDGIVGPDTWGALPADPNTPLLKQGSTGAAVTGLQTGLTKISGDGSIPSPGAIDGDFGPQTKASVKAYQTLHGLAADGIVGDRTWWVPAGAAGATLASLSGLTTV
jgi:peptidoglycan hydrolase-like protein with peptidoglycan-binding domain